MGLPRNLKGTLCDVSIESDSLCLTFLKRILQPPPPLMAITLTKEDPVTSFAL